MSTGFQALSEKPYESHYWYHEEVIDAPVEAVWEQALRIGAWMTDHRLETVDGQPGHVGHFERVYPQGLDPETPVPYHLYGIAHVDPPKYLALEVFSERGGSYGDERQTLGFDVISLHELDGKTAVGLLLIETTLGEGETRKPIVPQDDEHATLRERLPRYFENLRRLAVDGASAGQQPSTTG